MKRSSQRSRAIAQSSPRPHNTRWHSDDELKTRILELRGHGHTCQQIASILNEQGWSPLKGRMFTRVSVGQLLRSCDETKQLTPRRYLEVMFDKMEQAHHKASPDKPFTRLGLPKLAALLEEAGYRTPKGHDHWWPAQVQRLLDGGFDHHYQPATTPL